MKYLSFHSKPNFSTLPVIKAITPPTTKIEIAISPIPLIVSMNVDALNSSEPTIAIPTTIKIPYSKNLPSINYKAFEINIANNNIPHITNIEGYCEYCLVLARQIPFNIPTINGARIMAMSAIHHLSYFHQKKLKVANSQIIYQVLIDELGIPLN